MKPYAPTISIIFILASMFVGDIVLGETFETMKFHQEMSSASIDAINNRMKATNGIMIISSEMPKGDTPDEITEMDGITFEVQADEKINFIIRDEDIFGNTFKSPLSSILVNKKPLENYINEAIDQKIIDQKIKDITAQAMTNLIQTMVYNPLWGKKLAVIGDSLIASPSHETSYSYYVAQRNNMVLVHKGRSGEALCHDRTNELGVVTNPSCIKSYTNDIPHDADFILCQIGANDLTQWKWDLTNNVPDTDMSLDTFKGCFNNLLIGLKKNYPNAKVGIVLANAWTENLGLKSENVMQSETPGGTKSMIQWQKVQCQKLNIPVFDPQEDTRMFPYHLTRYPANGTTITEQGIEPSELSWYDRVKREIGTDQSQFRKVENAWVFQTKWMKDTQHTSPKGNMYLSFFYEHWMKTVLACD